MASLTMTASFLSAQGPALRSPPPAHRRLIVTNIAAKSTDTTSSNSDNSQESNNGRRDLMFAAAAAAMCSVAGMPMALADEPKRGSPQAKKAYAPICVTMPTARICHN